MLQHEACFWKERILKEERSADEKWRGGQLSAWQRNKRDTQKGAPGGLGRWINRAQEAAPMSNFIAEMENDARQDLQWASSRRSQRKLRAKLELLDQMSQIEPSHVRTTNLWCRPRQFLCVWSA